MTDNTIYIYLYDGTFDGFLTCIFEAFERKEAPAYILNRPRAQMELGTCTRNIETNCEHALRVQKGIQKKLGEYVLKMIYKVTLSDDERVGSAALAYLRLGFKKGKSALINMADDRVRIFQKIVRDVDHEAGRFLEFIRFSELSGGILFAEFAPACNVLPLIMPHFSDRLQDCPFIINDNTRHLAGVHDNDGWYIVSSAHMKLPENSQSEKQYQELWKLFFDTIAIKERINPKRQSQLMPKKYWKHMTEMQR